MLTGSEDAGGMAGDARGDDSSLFNDWLELMKRVIAVVTVRQ